MAKRTLIQILTAFLYNGNLPGFLNGRIWQGPSKSICVPGLNCYSCPGALGACPLGALQSSLSGVLLRFPFYVLGLMLLFGLLFGRTVCGWLCPFGFIQELLYKIPFVIVNIDGTKPDVTAFMENHAFSFPVALDTNGSAASAYAVQAIPTSYIIDADSNVVDSHIGALSAGDMESFVTSAF